MFGYSNHCEAFVEYLQFEKNASPYTIQYYQQDIDTFFLFCEKEGLQGIQDISYPVIRVYLTDLYEQRYSRRSVSRKISSLRTFFRFLEREHIVEANPFLSVSLPKADHPLPDFLYEKEMEKLFTVSDLTTPLGQRNQAILELLYGTGIRVSECTALELHSFDFTIETVLVMGKGKKERYVPFGKYAHEALERYMTDGRPKLLAKGNQSSTKMFLNARGRPITPRGIRTVLNDMVKKASLTVHVHPHKIRHTFATHMLNEGADLRSVQELLGHEHLSSTQIYTHVTKDHLRKIYKRSHPRA
ncbi:tyrosine recombinase XerC [Salirhabdus salicampi]|uniref:tyrosine recombinase XerC n=1 Tax=Salirhabdus salicampi TaxID=476102 RepID=UPI0020C269AD|nr:tyrosine recombinase XerC [Salirhabdus salicampi]MCP8616532.1 tyrosine recombinase XerC [Salirhabdus salicampi]